jgi:hypothetical protein
MVQQLCELNRGRVRRFTSARENPKVDVVIADRHPQANEDACPQVIAY